MQKICCHNSENSINLEKMKSVSRIVRFVGIYSSQDDYLTIESNADDRIELLLENSF